MATFVLRYDLRSPEWAATPHAALYKECLEQVRWADDNGFHMVSLAEHHGIDDGFLPSPLTMAAAVAARTTNVGILVSAMPASFHDPLRLAEDAAVVDRISAGRLQLVIANGYVQSEFEMFGRPLGERVARTREMIGTLKSAWTGEPFEFRGRTVRVTPKPHQPGGPTVALGGSTDAAARRAARLGVGFIPSIPDVWPSYRDELAKLGSLDPGPFPGGDTSFFHVARDPDAAWSQIAPFALHETNTYGRWMAEAGTGAAGGYEPETDAGALRRSGRYRVLTPDELVADLRAKGPAAFALLHPMMGGIPPALAWTSLRLFEHEVLPRL